MQFCVEGQSIMNYKHETFWLLADESVCNKNMNMNMKRDGTYVWKASLKKHLHYEKEYAWTTFFVVKGKAVNSRALVLALAKIQDIFKNIPDSRIGLFLVPPSDLNNEN